MLENWEYEQYKECCRRYSKFFREEELDKAAAELEDGFKWLLHSIATFTGVEVYNQDTLESLFDKIVPVLFPTGGVRLSPDILNIANKEDLIVASTIIGLLGNVYKMRFSDDK